MRYIITESQLKRIIEQDDWVRKAASGPQKCGKDAKWCGDNEGSSDGGKVRREKTMSPRQQEKYNETEYWNNQLLGDVTGLPDYSQRVDVIKNQIGSLSGKLSMDDRMKLVINLTNKLNKPSPWWFTNAVKKMVQPKGEKFTDSDIIKLVNMKGGFDAFKKYYLSDVII